jgi:predicted deacylase
MRLGTVSDYLGKPLVDARAPESGIVLFIRAVPSMTRGETIASIGVPAR